MRICLQSEHFDKGLITRKLGDAGKFDNCGLMPENVPVPEGLNLIYVYIKEKEREREREREIE